MKAKIKFIALHEDGLRKVKRVVKMDVPDFKESPEEDIVVCGETIHCPAVSVDTQIMEYLDSIDKRPLMDKYGWVTIIDYSVYNSQQNQNKNKVSVIDFLREMCEDEQILMGLAVTYQKLRKNIRHLPIMQQLCIIMDSLNLSYKASIAAYKRMDEINEKDENQCQETLKISRN